MSCRCHLGERNGGYKGLGEGWGAGGDTLVLDDYPGYADGGVGGHLLGAEAAALEALLTELGGAV